MVLNTIRFLLCSLLANMANVLINFRQKFALIQVFSVHVQKQPLVFSEHFVR